MADQGIWWKLWVSALDDPDLDNLPIADFGRYCKLGACIKRHGRAGSLAIAPPARTLCAMFQVPDYGHLLVTIKTLPHVTISTVSPETIATVTFDNWSKYQGDLSTPRVRRLREMKRHRREERRREEKRREIPPTVPPLEAPPANILKALDQSRLLGAVPRLRTMIFWRATIRATNNGHVDYAHEVLKAEAWLTANPTRAPRKDLARFLSNWLARAGGHE